MSLGLYPTRPALWLEKERHTGLDPVSILTLCQRQETPDRVRGVFDASVSNGLPGGIRALEPGRYSVAWAEHNLYRGICRRGICLYWAPGFRISVYEAGKPLRKQ